ncbi:MAG: shikimate kinase, partial [Candidatus Dormibacteria bacterium]
MRVEDLPLPQLPPGRPNLVLAGFMGVGKTTVGRLVADLLGMPFFDLDEEIEQRWGGSIEEIFHAEGEQGFRLREAELLEAAALLSGAVVAVGGGAVLHQGLFARLTGRSEVVPLECSWAELVGRLHPGQPGRPLLRGGEAEWAALHRDRDPLYRALGVPINTTGKTPSQVAEEVARRYQAQDEAPGVPLHGEATEVLVRPGALREMGSLLARVFPRAERAIVISEQGLELQRQSVIDALRVHGLAVRAIRVKG